MRFLLYLSVLSIIFHNTAWARQTPPDAASANALQSALQDSGFTDAFDGEVWLMDMSSRLKRRVGDRIEHMHFLKMVYQEARKAKLEPELVLAVIQIESNFDKFAISRVGARGLMQVMPFWVKVIGKPNDNLFDMRTNLRYGCSILRHYLDRENGNLRRALARYNGSIKSHRYPDLVFRALRKKWFPQ